MPTCAPARAPHPRYEQIPAPGSPVEAQANGLKVSFEGEKAPAPQSFDRVLVAVAACRTARRSAPSRWGESLRAWLHPGRKQMRTSVRISAIGDIAAPPPLAHKAMHEGKVARGSRRRPEAPRCPRDPIRRLHDPEIAWVGLTETEARTQGRPSRSGRLPVGG
jgi:dihydrolipoamide dehydrogenase